MKTVIFGLALGLLLASPAHASIQSEYEGVYLDRFLAKRNSAPFDFSELSINDADFDDAVEEYETKCEDVNEQYYKDLESAESGMIKSVASTAKILINQRYASYQEACAIAFDELDQIIKTYIEPEEEVVQVKEDPETIALLLQIIELLKAQIAALIAQRTL